jgi:hypothetical protein
MSEWIATVGYVRSLDISSLSVWCQGKRLGGYRCDHCADGSLAGYPDDLPTSAIERRLVCTRCGAIGAVDARPNWTELAGAPLYPSSLDRPNA